MFGHCRDAGRAAHQQYLAQLGEGQTCVVQCGVDRNSGAFDQIPVSSLNFWRVMVICKWAGPALVWARKGRFTSVD